MFFEKNNIQLSITDVLLIQRKNETIYTSKKPTHCISYRLEGESTFYCKNHIENVKKGDVLYIPSFLSYYQKSHNDKLIAIHFDTFEPEKQNLSLFHFSDPENINKKFLKLFDLWNSKQPGYRYRAVSILYDILADIQQQLYHPSPNKEQYELRISPSVKYLHCNYYKANLTLKDIASASNISEVYFRKLFHTLYDTSPLKYINDLRISRAITLILADNTPIKNIAATVGFTDALYFSRVFRQYTGMSPTEFRKKTFTDIPSLKPVNIPYT